MQKTLTSSKLVVHNDPIIAKKVHYYTEWLANEAQRNRIANSAKNIGEYEYIATQSTIVRGQEIVTFAPFQAEYSTWFDMTLPGLQALDVPLPLGGTSNHFRADVLRTVGAWDPFNVTEDCDLGLRLARHGLKTVMLDSTTLEEANPDAKNWMRQRSRWIKGYMQTYLVYMRHPLEYFRKRQIREFLSLQLIIGGKTAILLINPLMWMLLVIYILFHTFVSGVYHTLYPMPVLYMGTLCLIFGNVLYICTHLIGCMKRRHYRLVKSTLLIPIYWAMASGAAYIALYQLVFKPHYWEKTLHGMNLLKHTTTQKMKASTGKTLKAITRKSVADSGKTLTAARVMKAIKDEAVVGRQRTTPQVPKISEYTTKNRNEEQPTITPHLTKKKSQPKYSFKKEI